MKIVCDACTAKYSIADEKVAGKVFKIRCKKCENIIVVRGNTAEAAAPAEAAEPANRSTKVFDQDQDAPDAGMSGADSGDWHVVIDQEQVGPMSSDEVRLRFASGELDSESYIWKEGFADWERIPDVAEFADLENAAAPADDGGMFGTPVAAEPSVADSGGGLFGGDAGGGVDLFGGGAAGGAGGSDLFGGGNPAVGDNTGEIAMSKEAEAQLKGQRNENSVLFSLGNLAALASDAPKAAPSPASSPGVSNTGGSEGSGLIDIRSMASVYLADKSAAPSPGAGIGSADDLPVFSTSAFESASPLLMPTQSSGGDKKMLYTLFGIIAALVVAAAVLIVIVLGDDDKEKTVAAKADTAGDVTGDENSDTPPTVDPNAPDPDEAATNPDEVAPETGDPSETDPTTPKEIDTPSEEPKKAVVEPAANRAEKPLSRSEKRALARKEKADRARAKADRATRTVTPKEKPSSGGTCDEITCLVEPGKACCKKYAKKSKPTGSTSNSNLPDRLNKSDVKKGISRVKGRVSSCGDKHNGRGIVTVKIKISGTGKVTSAAASGGNSGLRSCVSSAVKRAKFAKTQKGGSVNYPFRF